MSDYVLLTDSSADLTDKLMREMGVEVLPLSFTIKGKTLFNYPDNREMSAKAFYRLLREGEMATTSAVNISDFTEKMEPLLQAGKDVLVLAFSSALSATCHSAQIAAQELGEKYPERKVYVVDTLCASLKALVDHMAETALDPAEQIVFISHGDCEADAQKVADDVKIRLGVKTVLLGNVGPVIGAHSGPGTVALFFLGSRR